MIDQDITVLVNKGTSEAAILANAQKHTSMGQVQEEVLNNVSRIHERVLSDPKTGMYMSFFEAVMNKEFKALMAFEENIPSQMALGLQMDSELRNCFNFHIMKMLQSGVMGEILNKWLVGRPGDMTDRIFVEDLTALGYGNLFFPVNLFLLGLVLSLVLLFSEKLSLCNSVQAMSSNSKHANLNQNSPSSDSRKFKLKFFGTEANVAPPATESFEADSPM